MLHKIVLYLEVEGNHPDININLNNKTILADVDRNKDQYGNIAIKFQIHLQESNNISIVLNNVKSTVKLKNMIIDDIQIGLVLFLCTTVNGKQDTQVDSDGQIDIAVNTPIWSWWCEKLNSFNYKDYPLGTAG
jgi:hypothetical protein